VKPHSRFTIFVALVCLLHLPLFSQIDSLLNALDHAKPDTAKITLLNRLTYEYRSTDTAKAFMYAREALALSRELKSTKGFGNTYYRMGGVYKFKRDFDNAISNYNQALLNFKIINDAGGEMKTYGQMADVYKQKGEYDHAFDHYAKLNEIATKQKDTSYMIDALGGFANIYRYKGDYVNSLSNYLTAVQMAESSGDLDQESGLLTNMALVYDYQDDTAGELKAYQRAYDINVQLHDSSDMILGNNNLAIFYYEHGQKARAAKCYNFSLQLIAKLGDERAGLKYVAQTYENIAMMAYDSANYKKAESLYNKALDYWLKTKQKKGISMAYGELASVEIAQENWNAAKDLLLKELDLCMEIGYNQGEMEANQNLANVMYQLGDYKKAYDYQARYIQLNQSITSDTKSAQLAEMQTKYESKQKEKELKERDEQIARNNEDAALKSKILYSLAGVAILFLALVIFGWRQFVQKKRAFEKLQGKNEEMQEMNSQISEQKAIIDGKNKDITDSIQYAKRIQQAILPHEQDVNTLLKESFIFYKPKDIISGDIYWVHEHGDQVFLAVIDCTGHGVPGALMSIIAQNALRAAFTGNETPTTAAVLSAVSKTIRETFSSHAQNEQINDGMDVGLYSIDRKKMMVGFSGANIPLILVRKKNVTEIKADKRLIEGNLSRAEVPFTQHNFPIEKGDMLYLYSDGYSDQFGGAFEKRFTNKELKLFLSSIQNWSMPEQKEALEKTFLQWKGDLEQIDDILMIGVRV
jgi:serine phosphatase RsbU (regulator of sigma subunit)